MSGVGASSIFDSHATDMCDKTGLDFLDTIGRNTKVRQQFYTSLPQLLGRPMYNIIE